MYEVDGYRVQDLENAVRKLERAQREFEGFEYQLTDLHSQLETLETSVERNERTAREQTEELEEKLDELESELGQAGRVLSRLGDRMGWVERHIRASGSAIEVEFDDLAEDCSALLAKIKQGQQAQKLLLGDVERRQLEQVVEMFAQQAKRIEELTTKALQTSVTLSTTKYGDEAHSAAAEAFRTAFKARQAQAKQHQQVRQRAEQARSRLAQDDEMRAASDARIQAGMSASQTFRLRLRTAIAEAIGDGALPPVWFASALGMTPPRGGANEWLATATEVLAYRITYRVTDPVSALGIAPAVTDFDRWNWHQQLTRQLGSYEN